jgi:predicted membrane channel-forming protein YqfA (hemolysin III family)
MPALDDFLSSLPYLFSALGQGLGVVFLILAGALIILGLIGSLLPESSNVVSESAFLVRTGTYLALSSCAVLAVGLLTWNLQPTLPTERLTEMGNDAFVLGAMMAVTGIVLFKLTEMLWAGRGGDDRVLAISLVGSLIMACGVSTIFVA